MSNRPHRPRRANRKLDRYAAALAATGAPEREVARAVFYADHYGMTAMAGKGDGCVAFAEPTCGNWNCLNPQHQVLIEG